MNENKNNRINITKREGKNNSNDYIVRLHPSNGSIEVRNDITEEESYENGYTVLAKNVSWERGVKEKKKHKKEHTYFLLQEHLATGEFFILREHRPYGLNSVPLPKGNWGVTNNKKKARKEITKKIKKGEKNKQTATNAA